MRDQNHHNRLELLAPAKNLAYGIEAINHGADAVYMGGPAFGARSAAGNSLEDIEALARHAHRFGAQVFVAFNTLLHDHELEQARRLTHQIYQAGADALIVQDMGLLALDLPPIALHASTQTDNRTPEKVTFLQDVGFSQVVLARELSLEQIRAISAQTQVQLEFFIHGALCVSYSGQCNISHARTGRSANRGECAQLCRLPCSLQTPGGEVLVENSHLLSLKDMDQSANLEALIEAGIRSFKIEGRLKGLDYVKNVTAWYRQKLDAILERRPDLVASSAGRCSYGFTPDPKKSFNRGSTDYFLHGRQPGIDSPRSPKYLGEPLGLVSRVTRDGIEIDGQAVTLNNGDGLGFFKPGGDLVGMRLNKVDGKQLLLSEPVPGLKVGAEIYRNHDQAFSKLLEKASADRRIRVDMRLSECDEGLRLELMDEQGVGAAITLPCDKQPADNPARALQQARDQLGKLGNTLFVARQIELVLTRPLFIAASMLNGLRRDGIAALEAARLAAYRRPERRIPLRGAVYPQHRLSYLGNVLNGAAEQFFREHGVGRIAPAYEANQEQGEVVLMTTRHCIRYSQHLCPKEVPGLKAEPLELKMGKDSFRLRFDCHRCEMQVMGSLKG
ncbi:U32 family peptidase [Aeromonas caviae]|uniref:peptidase U32 family protein n=1 Tax=Aeromonas caviae TaxID=648 RepID=UPI000537EF38|nr:U32 family peptidase [Aeromonas caviae]AUU22020.1 U32 family peptidase [Aeromonas caviae]QOK20139.1 U32 family peptidase [Aeromonas caviae]